MTFFYSTELLLIILLVVFEPSSRPPSHGTPGRVWAGVQRVLGGAAPAAEPGLEAPMEELGAQAWAAALDGQVR